MYGRAFLRWRCCAIQWFTQGRTKCWMTRILGSCIGSPPRIAGKLYRGMLGLRSAGLVNLWDAEPQPARGPAPAHWRQLNAALTFSD